MAKVWFVGAGSGDPELITLKAQKLIQQADAILAVDSECATIARQWAKSDAEIAESNNMTTVQITDWLLDKAQGDTSVVCLQFGDPCLYSSLIEMTQPLEATGIEIGVVPGIPSAMTAAAAAIESLTLQKVTESVIFTRLEKNSPMPEGESLQELAQHQCTLCIYSSVDLLNTIQAALLGAAWEDDAAVLVVNKSNYPNQEKIIRGTLTDIKEKCAAAKIDGQAMIIVSPALGAREWLGQ